MTVAVYVVGHTLPQTGASRCNGRFSMCQSVTPRAIELWPFISDKPRLPKDPVPPSTKRFHNAIITFLIRDASTSISQYLNCGLTDVPPEYLSRLGEGNNKMTIQIAKFTARTLCSNENRSTTTVAAAWLITVPRRD